MIYCGFCKQYVESCPHTRVIVDAEPKWGWVAFCVFLGMAVVAVLGTCA